MSSERRFPGIRCVGAYVTGPHTYLTASLLAMYCLAGIAVGCRPCKSGEPVLHSSRDEHTARRRRDIQRIASCLIEMPDWIDSWAWSQRERARKWNDITVGIATISQYDTDIIREGIETYLASGEASWPDAAGKLYVLNKYLFNWPDVLKNPGPGYLGHAPGRLTGSIWPLSRNEEGKLVLGRRPMKYYAGPPYEALVAFDFAERVYGRRGTADHLRSRSGKDQEVPPE